MRVILAIPQQDGVINEFVKKCSNVEVIREIFYYNAKTVQDLLPLNPELIIISEYLPGDGDIDLPSFIYLMKAQSGTRIIFLANREQDDPLLHHLVSLGVYDIMNTPEISLIALAKLIFMPNRYQHVAHFHNPGLAPMAVPKIPAELLAGEAGSSPRPAAPETTGQKGWTSLLADTRRNFSKTFSFIKKLRKPGEGSNSPTTITETTVNRLEPALPEPVPEPPPAKPAPTKPALIRKDSIPRPAKEVPNSPVNIKLPFTTYELAPRPNFLKLGCLPGNQPNLVNFWTHNQPGVTFFSSYRFPSEVLKVLTGQVPDSSTHLFILNTAGTPGCLLRQHRTATVSLTPNGPIGINPLDLVPGQTPDPQAKMIFLSHFLDRLLKGLSGREPAILAEAIAETYRRFNRMDKTSKDTVLRISGETITLSFNPGSHQSPLLSDLWRILRNFPEPSGKETANRLAARLFPWTLENRTVFNRPTGLDLYHSPALHLDLSPLELTTRTPAAMAIIEWYKLSRQPENPGIIWFPHASRILGDAGILSMVEELLNSTTGVFLDLTGQTPENLSPHLQQFSRKLPVKVFLRLHPEHLDKWPELADIPKADRKRLTQCRFDEALVITGRQQTWVTFQQTEGPS